MGASLWYRVFHRLHHLNSHHLSHCHDSHESPSMHVHVHVQVHVHVHADDVDTLLLVLHHHVVSVVSVPAVADDAADDARLIHFR
jgi:hypothetical protein